MTNPAFAEWLQLVSDRLWLRTGRWLADITYRERTLWLFWRCEVTPDEAAAALEWRVPKVIVALTRESICRTGPVWWTNDSDLAAKRAALFAKLNLQEKRTA